MRVQRNWSEAEDIALLEAHASGGPSAAIALHPELQPRSVLARVYDLRKKVRGTQRDRSISRHDMLDLPKMPDIAPIVTVTPRIEQLDAGEREYLRRRLEAEFVEKIARELSRPVESVRAAIADGLRPEKHFAV